jgi:hypothetical protein
MKSLELPKKLKNQPRHLLKPTVVLYIFQMVRRGSLWCGVAQLAARRLAVRQATKRVASCHQTFKKFLKFFKSISRDSPFK